MDKGITPPSPPRILFWSGAGISVPVGGPLGDKLTNEVIDLLCLPGTGDAIAHCFRRFRPIDASGMHKAGPRLELVLDKLFPIDRSGVVELITRAFGPLHPGAQHRFFARHLRAGGGHVTVNVDDCLGAALRLEPAARCHLHGPLHLHGRVRSNEDRQVDRLGLQLSEITSGLPERRARLILRMLGDASWLVFVGYSGRDHFDVTPFFLALPGRGVRLDRLTVVWLKHVGSLWPPRDVSLNDWRDGRAILEALARCGATIRYQAADTEIWLRGLAAEWGWSWPEMSGDMVGQAQDVLQPTPAAWPLLATAELYAAFGLSREMVPLVEPLVAIRDSGDVPLDQRRRAAELAVVGLRDAGLYRRAEREARALSRTPGVHPVRAAHLQGDVAWLGQRWLLAGVRFVRGIVKARRGLAAARSPVRAELIEFGELIVTTLHWLRDVRSLPLFGRLVPRALAVALWRELDKRPGFWHGNPRAADAFPRLLADLRAAGIRLRAPRGMRESRNEAIDAFAETDSLIGVVNSQRSAIKNGIRNRTLSAESIHVLLARSHVLGDRPGVLKAALLGAWLSPLETRVVLRSWLQIEWPVVAKVAWLVRLLGSPALRPAGARRRTSHEQPNPCHRSE
jgi:hypothetical protein